MKGDYDAVIVGAGAAGLAALEELDRAGLQVVCVEARDRIGGRVYTMRDPLFPKPIELGAEFIHGRPPEIWDIVRSQRLLAYDCAENAVHVKNGLIESGENGWQVIDRVMEDMQKAAKRGKDRNFLSYIASSPHPEDAKQLAISYVEGFNAARKEIISIASLAKDAKASDEIDGDHSFRFVDGYDALMQGLIARVDGQRAKLRLSTILRRIEWRAGRVTVHAHSTITAQTSEIHAARAIVTVPLGVLQSAKEEKGYISFDPQPGKILEAARALEVGQVMRLVLRFQEAFWEKNEELASAGFFLSDEKFFPTWWVPLPVRAPLITGWSAGPHADELLGAPEPAIVGHAIHDLARITSMRESDIGSLLEAAYFHDWHADAFARGAYSYVPVGALKAREVLATPVAGTLFFAGEATETNGHSATVHGAIASGRRAAGQILKLSDP